jgi:hypothetical protein
MIHGPTASSLFLVRLVRSIHTRIPEWVVHQSFVSRRATVYRIANRSLYRSNLLSNKQPRKQLTKRQNSSVAGSMS